MNTTILSILIVTAIFSPFYYLLMNWLTPDGITLLQSIIVISCGAVGGHVISWVMRK